MRKISEVFGTGLSISSKISRPKLDEGLCEAIDSGKSVVIYGAPRQGKSSLLKQNIDADKMLYICLHEESTIRDVYQSILRQCSIKIKTADETSYEDEKKAKISSKFKAAIAVFVSGEVEMGAELGAKRKKAEKHEEIPFNLNNPQDVSELLQKVSFDKIVVLDHFEQFSTKYQLRFAMDLAVFHEHNFTFIVLASWRERHKLLSLNMNLIGKVADINVEPWTSDELTKVINSGCVDLNCILKDETIKSCIEHAHGNIGDLQLIISNILSDCEFLKNNSGKYFPSKLNEVSYYVPTEMGFEQLVSNISLDINRLQSELGEKLSEMDKIVHSIYYKQVISEKEGATEQPFSIEKLLSSLGVLGLPIQLKLQVASNLLLDLYAISKDNDTLHASTIRRSVASILYKIESLKADDIEILRWADNYIRRYGDPDQRIVLILDDGEPKILDYEIIYKNIIPDLLRDVLKRSIHEDNYELSDKQRRKLGKEILKVITSLNVYRIKYTTIISLLKEVATQPPHPWMVEKGKEYETINYDIDKATKHYMSIDVSLDSGDIDKALYSVGECIHHTSSAILANCNVIMGCGYMQPFHNLVHICNEHKIGKFAAALRETNVDKFFNALIANGITGDDFILNLDSISRLLNTKSQNSEVTIDKYLREAKAFYELGIKLLNKYIRLKELNEIRFSLFKSEKEFRDVIIKLLADIPYCTISDKSKTLWVIHEINSPLMQIYKPKILILPVYGDISEADISEINKLILKNLHNCNTCIVIVRGNLRENIVKLKKAIDSQINSLVVSVYKVLDVVISDDPIRYIADAIKIDL